MSNRIDPVKAAADAAGQAITLAREATEAARDAVRWATVSILVGIVELAVIVALVVTK